MLPNEGRGTSSGNADARGLQETSCGDTLHQRLRMSPQAQLVCLPTELSQAPGLRAVCGQCNAGPVLPFMKTALTEPPIHGRG